MPLLEAVIGDNRQQWAEVAASLHAALGIPRPTVAELFSARPETRQRPAPPGKSASSLAALRRLQPSPETDDLLIRTWIASAPFNAWGSANSLVEYADSPVTTETLRQALRNDLRGSSYIAMVLANHGNKAILPDAVARAFRVTDDPRGSAPTSTKFRVRPPSAGPRQRSGPDAPRGDRAEVSGARPGLLRRALAVRYRIGQPARKTRARHRTCRPPHCIRATCALRLRARRIRQAHERAVQICPARERFLEQGRCVPALWHGSKRTDPCVAAAPFRVPGPIFHGSGQIGGPRPRDDFPITRKQFPTFKDMVRWMGRQCLVRKRTLKVLRSGSARKGWGEIT